MSIDIARRRIDDLSAGIRNQLTAEAIPMKISLQSIEYRCNLSIFSQLICFVRYGKEKHVEEEFLFCEALLTTTTAKVVFKLVKEFFASITLV